MRIDVISGEEGLSALRGHLWAGRGSMMRPERVLFAEANNKRAAESILAQNVGGLLFGKLDWQFRRGVFGGHRANQGRIRCVTQGRPIVDEEQLFLGELDIRIRVRFSAVGYYRFDVAIT